MEKVFFEIEPAGVGCFEKNTIFAPAFKKGSISEKSPDGGIGRRVRFRCVCRKVCRFKSCSGHERKKTKVFFFLCLLERFAVPYIKINKIIEIIFDVF